eukprot:12416063-Heterocapsa_arctica.AAC.1
MSLLDIAPYLDMIECVESEIVMERCSLREQNLSKLLHTILASCLTTGRARSAFRLVPDANGFEAYRRVLL